MRDAILHCSVVHTSVLVITSTSAMWLMVLNISGCYLPLSNVNHACLVELKWAIELFSTQVTRLPDTYFITLSITIFRQVGRNLRSQLRHRYELPLEWKWAMRCAMLPLGCYFFDDVLVDWCQLRPIGDRDILNEGIPTLNLERYW